MGTNFGDVGVFAVAELEVVVAWLCVRRQRRSRAGTCWRDGPIPLSDVGDRFPGGYRAVG